MNMNGLEALADPRRRKIVEMLAEGELSAGEIGKRFEVSAPAISQHLKVLREAKVVRVRIDGQHRIYQLDPDGLEEIANWLNGVRRFWSAKLDVLDNRLRKPPHRKGPKQ